MHNDAPELSAPITTLDLLGGRLVLDFVNTVEPRTGARRVDFLPDHAALVDFVVHAGVETAEQGALLHAAAAGDPLGAAAVARRARMLREALHRVLVTVACGAGPDRADLAVVAVEHARTAATLQLRPTGAMAGPALAWAHPPDIRLDRPLWLITGSAEDVLTRDDPSRLRVCPAADGGCGWLFHDGTRNRSRRWCSMRYCGSRAKARRLTARRRRPPAGAS